MDKINNNSFNNLTSNALLEIKTTVLNGLTAQQEIEISKIIQSKIVDAVVFSSRSCISDVVACCGPEADLAHKIKEEGKRTENALIANLMGMR